VPDAKQGTAETSAGALSEDFVDRAELACRLGVHERTIRRMVERGELPRPCLSSGGRPRWLWSYVLDYCHKQHEHAVKVDRKMRRELK